MNLLKHFRRKPKLSDEELAKMLKISKPKTPTEWWQFPFRIVSTHRGGPNMPKYQRCPDCGGGAKRKEKTVGGAIYQHCGTRWLVRCK